MFEFDTATKVLDGLRPQTADDYRIGFRRHLLRMERAEWPQEQPLRAGVDCGRWVVNCVCGGGIALHPDWQFAGCFTCGRSWSKIIFPTPEFLAKVDAILRGRPPGTIRKDPRRFWSWWPEETLDDLRRQNIRHGWSVPEE